MLDPQLLKEIKRIQLTAGHLATEVLAGNYASAFKGQGMEFSEVREYIPGDDIRSIDWNVTARMSQPFIKKFREERELTMMLLIDVSGSQDFSSSKRTKMQCCTELAGLLAYLATKNNDKVGVILFSDIVEKYIPPKKGRAHIWHIIRSVLTHEKRGGKTRIDKAIDFLMQTQKKRSLVFLVSDFFATDYEKSLRVATKRHEMICVVAEDKRELEIPNIGFLQVCDQETGERTTINASAAVIQKYKEQAADRLKALSHFFKKQKIDSFELDSAAESAAKPLVSFMHRRQSLSRRSRG